MPENIGLSDPAAILRHGEDEHTAFETESVSLNRLAETLAALANSNGGTVILGVDPRGSNLRGIRDPEAAADKALAAGLRSEPPLILPRPELTNLAESQVLLILVPAGLPHAFSVRGRYYVRSGKKNALLGPRQLRQLLKERVDVNLEARPAPDATIEDLDDALVQSYACAFLGDPIPNKKQAVLDLLCRRGCIVKESGTWRPTVSGVLLFGSDPQRWFPSAEIILARYGGKQMSDEFLHDVARGPLTEQLRRAETFVASNMRKGSRIESLQRADRPEYPMPAVREAIVNAVAHRDYTIQGEEIRILMFLDRIEIYSPGRLAGHVTIDNIVDERFSRNQVIAQVLADLGYVERLGYGIDRMIRLMKDWGLPAPRFSETANGFKVTLRGPGERWATEDEDRLKWAQAQLNERQSGALAFLTKNSRITNRDLHELFPEVSEETLRRDLADLVDQGLVLKMGDKRGTFYILK